MKSQFQNLAQWERHYSQAASRQQYPDENVVRYFAKLLRQVANSSSLTVLDLGSGSGRHIKYLKTLPLRVIGCDYSWQALQGQTDCLQAHAAALPFRDSCFDIVLCWGVIHYLPEGEIPTLVGEVYRVLKPGGRFLLTLRSNQDTHIAQTITKGDLAGGKVKLYSLEEAKDLLQTFRDLKTGFMARQPLGETTLIVHHLLEAIK